LSQLYQCSTCRTHRPKPTSRPSSHLAGNLLPCTAVPFDKSNGSKAATSRTHSTKEHTTCGVLVTCHRFTSVRLVERTSRSQQAAIPHTWRATCCHAQLSRSTSRTAVKRRRVARTPKVLRKLLRDMIESGTPNLEALP